MAEADIRLLQDSEKRREIAANVGSGRFLPLSQKRFEIVEGVIRCQGRNPVSVHLFGA